ncbi:MAG: hypothetical protein WC145_03075 [Aliarcobacter sp.]|jgi:hypothetical protein|uniref:hypothetical protein n=1 Tax=Aliarcobacter cryaerophilus TaxID=28198 RepID=UPI0021B31655|nr:hypothetical protein [Aliarcobacter cryaerophilus]MCT7433755.1 hypothetical protein [Aliarcobacter cryaerophilus]
MSTQKITKGNLEVLHEAFGDEIIKQVVSKLDNYESKIKDIFKIIEELQEMILLQANEQKAKLNSQSELEINARISKSMEEFELQFEKMLNDKKTKNNNKFVYLMIVIAFLLFALFLK